MIAGVDIVTPACYLLTGVLSVFVLFIIIRILTYAVLKTIVEFFSTERRKQYESKKQV